MVMTTLQVTAEVLHLWTSGACRLWFFSMHSCLMPVSSGSNGSLRCHQSVRLPVFHSLWSPSL